MPAQFLSCSVILAGARDNICATLPFPNYHSVPIPTRRRQRLCVAMLIGRGEFVSPQDGYLIWPPHLLALFDVSDGSLDQLRGITNEDPEKPFGKGLSPVDLMTVPVQEARLKYCEMADRVIAASRDRAGYSRFGEDLFSLFLQSAGQALAPYWEPLFMKDIG